MPPVTAADDRPLGSYAAFTAVFGTTLAGALVAAKRSGRDLPERIEARDVVLIGVSSYKLSRLISKSRVTSFVRAPFTEHQESVGHGEVDEKPRGDGLRRSIGELLVCPYCIAQWITGGFTVGMVFAPRTTRVVATVYAAEALSDFLQVAYRAGEDRT